MPGKTKGGRPRVGRPTGRKVTVYLLPDVEDKARKIGAGNLSGGVAKAVHAFNDDFQREQRLKLNDLCKTLRTTDRDASSASEAKK